MEVKAVEFKYHGDFSELFKDMLACLLMLFLTFSRKLFLFMMNLSLSLIHI